MCGTLDSLNRRRVLCGDIQSHGFSFFPLLPQLVKLCSGMIEAGRAYVSANKLFVNGIKDLSQQCKKEEVISVSVAPKGSTAKQPSIRTSADVPAVPHVNDASG